MKDDDDDLIELDMTPEGAAIWPFVSFAFATYLTNAGVAMRPAAGAIWSQAGVELAERLAKAGVTHNDVPVSREELNDGELITHRAKSKTVPALRHELRDGELVVYADVPLAGRVEIVMPRNSWMWKSQN